MGNRGHNRHGPKRGGLLCPFLVELGPRLNNVAWAEVYFRTKWRLHPSSRLATIDMGQKLGGVGCALFSGGSLVLIEHKVAWLRHIPPCQVPSRSIQPFGHNKYGPKIRGGLRPLYGEGGAGSPSNTKSPGPRPIAIPSGVLIYAAIWPQRIWTEIVGCTLLGEGVLGPHLTQWPTCLPSFILIRQTVWPQYTNVTDRQTANRTEQTDRTENGFIA